MLCKKLDAKIGYLFRIMLIKRGFSGCRVQGAGCRVQGAGCRVQGAGCRVQGAGCKVQGAVQDFQEVST
jgi:hypothetical protein